MKNYIVLGIGSRLLMDDGIGVYVVEELIKQDIYSSINYIIGETDIDFCLEKINDGDCLIIIDAARLGKPAGSITLLKFEEAINKIDLGLTMHNLHLFDMLKLSGKIDNGLIIGIEPYIVDYSFGLSTVLGSRLKDITTQVFVIINHYLTEYLDKY